MLTHSLGPKGLEHIQNLKIGLSWLPKLHDNVLLSVCGTSKHLPHAWKTSKITFQKIQFGL